MRPLGWVGVIIVIVGAIAASGHLPYKSSRSEMQVGPMSVSSEAREYVPPTVGFALILVGGALAFVGRKRKS